MARLTPITQFHYNGAVVANGTVETYVTGTTTPKPTYTDATEGTSNGNSVTLDAIGYKVFWLATDQSYRFVVKNSSGTPVLTLDNISGISDPLVEAHESHNIKLADGRGLLDDSGNEVLTINKVASAVNYVEASNAATGNDVSIEAKGDDSNVPLNLKSKGTAALKLTSGGTTFSFATSDGSSGQFIKTNGSGTLSFGALTGLVAGHIQGLRLSNDTDASHDIAISAGSARDFADSVTMTLGSTLTKQIDAGWTAGDDAGGLPAGVALTSNTWYHVFLIEDGAGTVDAGFDTSTTASNLLTDSSYTKYRRLGSVLTDSSANILAFEQIDKKTFFWVAPTRDINTTTLSTTRTNYTIPVPPDYTHMAILDAVYANGAANTSVYMSNPNLTDSAPSTTTAPLAQMYVTTGNVLTAPGLNIPTDTSSQISARADQASTTLRVSVRGYIDGGIDI